MKLHSRFLLAALALSFPLLSSADTDADAIKSAIEQRHSGISVKDVQPSPIPGLYEVFAGGQIIYASKNAEYVLVGATLFEDASKRNLTSSRMQELTRIDFSTLPLQDAIEIKKGNGKFKFAVFSDPDCPYCKSLETGLEKLGMSDYTAYVFLFPLEEIHKEARWKAEAVWCAKDRQTTWHDWMVDSKPLEKASCDNPLDRNLKLGDKIGVQGTPSIYLSNGIQTSSPQDLVEAMKAESKAK
jgi:thiol:disulfide interchange protein DsbC